MSSYEKAFVGNFSFHFLRLDNALSVSPFIIKSNILLFTLDFLDFWVALFWPSVARIFSATLLGTEPSIGDALYKASPILGSVPRRVAENILATEGQKRATQKSRKSRVKSNILDLMIKGETDKALSNLRKWNEKFPTNAFSYDDISPKTIYRKVLNKQIRINQENRRLGVQDD